MSRVLLTGATGFIGSVVARRLMARGASLRCLIRESSDRRRLEGVDYEIAWGDVRDIAAVSQALDGCESCVHLASVSNWSDISSGELEEVIVGGTRNVLEGARSLSCRRVLYTSSTTAIGGTSEPEVLSEESRPDFAVERYPYAWAKRRAEELCRRAAATDLDVVVVRPAEVYGPNDWERVTCGNLIDFASGGTVPVCRGGTSIVHVEDAAAGIVAAFERGTSGESYILGGENLTIAELARLTRDLLGREGRILQLPNRLVLALGWAGRHLRVPLPFDPEVARYATLFWFVDSGKARRELGVHFRDARATLEPTLDWCEEAGYAA